MMRTAKRLRLFPIVALCLAGCANPSAWIGSLWPTKTPRPTAPATPTTPTTPVTPPVLPVAQVPTLSPTPGIFPSDQSLIITDTTLGSSVIYTTDGTAPGASSAIYLSPLPLGGPNQTYKVVAIGRAAGMTDSPAVNGNYMINPNINAVSVSPIIINWPWGIAVAPNDDIYIASTNSEQIVKLDHVTFSPSIVAGSGNNGSNGDNDSALLADLNSPQAIAVDAEGNIFIADTLNNRVRKVEKTSGNILAFAGTGAIPSSSTDSAGDGFSAINAQLNQPGGVAVDSAGNVYIADSHDNRIRMVDTAGVIHTIAGTGAAGAAANGPALSAQLSLPQGIFADSSGSNIYFSDYGSESICKLSAGSITIVAGGAGQGHAGDGTAATTAQMDNPMGMTIDKWGNLYIADCYNQAIRKVGADGKMVTIAGVLGSSTADMGDGAAATASRLSGPSGVAVDSSGRLFIIDTGNNRPRSVP